MRLLAALCLLWNVTLGIAAPATIETRALSDIAQSATQRASAAVLADHDSLISTDISAVVQAVHHDVGAQVDKGALLLTLDDADYRLALAQTDARLRSARASAELATQRYDRAVELQQKGYASADDLLARKTELQSAEADIRLIEAERKIAQRRLDKCAIRAPFAGVIVERAAQLGAMVAAGAPLLRLVSSATPELEAQLSAEQAASLAAARDLRFQVGANDFPVVLLRLSPVLDARSRTQVARFGFAQSAPASGQSGQLLWSGGMAVAPELLVKRGGALGVFVQRGGVAVYLPIADAQLGRAAVVDLPADTQVVVSGHQALRDGDPIGDR